MALVVPLLLVNSAALYGQAGWAYDHLAHVVLVAVLFAAAVESIGVYLAYEAHAALLANHASGGLRAGSYGIGALVGALNYAHFASAGYAPNPLAVTFGLLSSISPWLWAIRSRSINRVRLAELGLIDPRAVKFSRLRWMLFPLRTVAAFRAAVWAGVQSPIEAVALADARRIERRTAKIERRDRRRAVKVVPVDVAPTPETVATQPAPVALPVAPTARSVSLAVPSRVVATRPRATMSRDAQPSDIAEQVRRLWRDGNRDHGDIARIVGVSKRTAERHTEPLRQINGFVHGATVATEEENGS